MITGVAVPAPRYTITGVSPRRHAVSRDFAGALGAHTVAASMPR